ncbi:glycosyltransferase [Candidatus Falkowbacteria bacterium]|jgi:teichuronic acid biosynthesis glycosyltransferase TuaH|nr:glycosyltransferase [Candidatus Falkowbacteria bacterium]MBT6573508.1 glycosyltransferase [Candidatus Falkowbacteria bacterium]MBT7348058.1 glycosyltransferase [Candidatus Falkowbacteria bacterium]MBT7501107.1 glycosyltransferase [Candidatus Falkowbacteria bacterium]
MPDIYGYDNEKVNIIMFNMSSFFDWDHGIVNRNYNILHSLEKDDRIGKIVGVDFLPIGWKKAVKHYFQNILWEIRTADIVYGDLTSACYRRTDKIYAYTSIDSLFSFKKVARELKRVEKMLNLNNVVFWSYNPMFTEFIGKLNEKMFIFDTVDNWVEHPQYTKLMRKGRLGRNYKKIADKANLIFTVSDELKDFYKEMDRTKDVHWIPNGVDFDLFNDPEKIDKENELNKLEGKIIGYFGTIEDRLDFDLIATLAKKHKDKQIVLCGPIWPVVKHEFNKKLGKYKNITTTGRIKYQDAPSYINKFDVAIIPHKINNFIKSTNPMKMYEYLACGKPVVTTKGAGVDMFKDLMYITNDHDKFSDFIDQAIAEDSPELTAKRRNAVKKHSWRARVEKMTELMFNKLEIK